MREINHAARGLLAGALVLSVLCAGGGVAQAGKKQKNIKIAQADQPAVESLRVMRGEEITLPMENVTRITPADEEIARARFVDGKAVIKGVTTGVTTVEVQQGSAAAGTLTSQRYEVEVLDETMPAPAGADDVAPAGDAEPLTATVGGTSTTTTQTTQTTSTELPTALPTDIIIPTDTTPVETAITPGAIAPDDTPPATLPVGKALTVSLGVEPAEDNPSQALFTITYGNPTSVDATGVVIRYLLDDMVSYVTASATGGARYDAAARELVWNVGTLPAGTTGQTVSFRIAAIDTTVPSFFSAAAIESENGASFASNPIEYSFNPTPLLTVFALPDRILEGKSGPPYVDVRGIGYQNAIDRLQKMGVVVGTAPGRFDPGATTQRAEYTVMILRGLNLKDLRDMSAIKFVLARHATVKLDIRDSSGKVVSSLIKNSQFDAGERTVIWDGRTATGYARPGRYSYTCSARDAKGIITTLRGYINVVPQTALDASGTSSFIDIRPNSWYASYIAQAEKQHLVEGYPNKEFRPISPINRVEATAIVVRAIGLEDLATRAKGKEAGFLDDHLIPDWGTGYVYVASTIIKTSSGKLIVGYPSNMYLPLNPMRRDEAAVVIQRLVDKETNRKIYVNGQMVPGATVTINGQKVVPADDGSFSFTLEQNTAEPTSVAVIDRRR